MLSTHRSNGQRGQIGPIDLPALRPADRTGPCQVFTDLMSRYTPTRPEEMQR